MRFAMVTTFYPPYGFGGDATYVRSLSRELAARGHEVEVMHCADAFRLLNGGEPAAKREDDPGVLVHTIESALGVLSPIVTQQTSRPGLKHEQLRKLLVQDFDVVHFHNISLIGGLGALELSTAPCTLYTLHEHWLLCPTHVFWKDRSRPCDKPTCFSCCLRSGIPPQLWRYTRMREIALRHVDCLISPSEYTAARHRAGGVTQPIHVAPHFSALESATLGPPPQLPRPYFLYVGRITASKGIEALTAAFAGLPKYQLVLAGGGDLRATLMHKYAACANLHFLGPAPQADLAALYAHARAVILPSLAPETFGLTVIEAASLGTPALVRRGAGGAEEIVESTRGGFIYGDADNLMGKVAQLTEDAELHAQLRENARSAYLRDYTLEKHLERYFDCIDRVLSSKGAQRSP